MGTLLVEDVVNSVRDVLQDSVSTTANPYRWSDALLWRKLTRAQREVVRLVPSANPIRQAFQLTPLVTLQDLLPSDAFEILAVIRNMGADGATPGRPLHHMPRPDLDAQVPNWHAGRMSMSPSVWTQEVEERKKFYIFPRIPAGGQAWVELLFSQAPASIVSRDSKITIDDIYEYPLVTLTAAFSLQDNMKGADPGRGLAMEQRGYTMLQASFAEQQGTEQRKGAQ